MKNYTFAIICALGFGITPVLARYGGAQGMPAILGTTWGTMVALPCFYFILRLRGRPLTFAAWPRRTKLFVLSTGLCSSLGVLFYWLALSRERVSIVVSVNSAFPLLTIAMSFVLLRHDERITLRLLLGGIFVVCGVLIITS